MNEKQQLGKIGENIASEYLEKKGYLILERNFACRQGEIDIIAKDEKEFVLVRIPHPGEVWKARPRRSKKKLSMRLVMRALCEE